MLNLLSLNNFKSIKDEGFELRKLTLFSGLNGMGKSSVLQSLLLLRQSYDKHMLPDIGISLTGEYAKMGTGKDLLYTNAEAESVGIEARWDSSALEFNFYYDENSDIQPVNKSSRIEIDGLKIISRLLFK